ncbi:MAG: glyoxalase [Coleofasciculaceae cyanobacterium SM2_1_6]|nr:glyoxalase [Coleofasciculaceae cyanobacterium SM2_1_6]
MSVGIDQYLHTAITVRDLDAAIYFYGTVLGLERVNRVLRFPGAWYQLGETQIHLIVPEQITAPAPPDPSQKWGRNPHLAFRVANLDKAKEQLLKHNCPIQGSASGRPALFTQDPDGNVIELSQG